MASPLLPPIKPTTGLDVARFLSESRLGRERINVAKDRIELEKQIASINAKYRDAQISIAKEVQQLSKWERAFKLGGTQFLKSPDGKRFLNTLANGEWPEDETTGVPFLNPKVVSEEAIGKQVGEIQQRALQSLQNFPKQRLEELGMTLAGFYKAQKARGEAEEAVARPGLVGAQTDLLGKQAGLTQVQTDRLRAIQPFEIQKMVADNKLTLAKAEQINEMIPYDKRLSEAHAASYESGSALDRARVKVAEQTAKKIETLTPQELINLRAQGNLTLAETNTMNTMLPYKQLTAGAQILESTARQKQILESTSRMKLLAPYEVDELRSRTQRNIAEIYRAYNLTDAQVNELGAQAEYHLRRAAGGDWFSVGIAETGDGTPAVVLHDRTNNKVAAVEVPDLVTGRAAAAREKAAVVADPVIKELVQQTTKKGAKLYKVGIYSRLSNEAKALEVAGFLRSNGRNAIVYEAPGGGIRGKEYAVQTWNLRGEKVVFGDRNIPNHPEARVISAGSGKEGTSTQKAPQRGGTPQQRQNEMVDEFYKPFEYRR